MSFVNAKTTMDNRAVVVANTSIWRNQEFVWYQADTQNQIRGGEKMAFYVTYSCAENTLSSWNQKYPAFPINNVTLKFTYTPYQSLVSGNSSAQTQVIEILNLSQIPFTFFDLKKFFYLADKETMLITLDTTYASQSAMTRDTYCRFDVVLGSEGCNRCLELDYQEFEADVSEAGTIRSYNSGIKDKIVTFLQLHYEFLVILYYAILITILLTAITMIVYIIFLLYHIVVHFIGSKKQ